ncbi:hypothetical protein LAD62_09155 [Klebsiella pneumoniae]|uniref:hypothetical protein n=1 Tax=Klebsiella pneumoniae TaxID=573 RepID=UPI00226DCBFD|nr:hypothetical protein [Klebsiella pneumoniae]MCX9755684.1 hypothetical protein [Klebsiella pneumoniae]MCX9765859.1 hypothetical protein [Klebsiella pneumoniae]
MAQITDQRLAKILSETQETIMEHSARCARGSVEVNARLFESLLMELQYRRKSTELEIRTVRLPKEHSATEFLFPVAVYSAQELTAALAAQGIKVEDE